MEDMNSYFFTQAAKEAIMFYEMIQGDPKSYVTSTFMNSMARL